MAFGSGSLTNVRRIDEIHDHLQRYFAKDERHRFEVENFIDEGAEGQTWKVKYGPQGLPPTNAPGPSAAPPPQHLPIRRLALKISLTSVRNLQTELNRIGPVIQNQNQNQGVNPNATAVGQPNAANVDQPDAMDVDQPADQHAPAPDNEDDTDEEVEDDDVFTINHPAAGWGIAKEKKVLNSWRWAMHIVKAFRPKVDPLTKSHQDLTPLQFGPNRHLYMEFLENGTLYRFIRRANRDPVTGDMLPNRLLWKIFLCLVRICCAQLYPPKRPPGNPPKLVPETYRTARLIRGGIDHGDTHLRNVMFGDMTAGDDEHSLVPILKLIDMGFAELIEPNDNEHHRIKEKEFVFTAAEFMYDLIVMDPAAHASMPRPEDIGVHAYEYIAVRPGGPEIETCAWGIVGDGVLPDLDDELRRTVCACLATDPDHRPNLRELIRVVRGGATNKTAQYYQNLGNANETDAIVAHILQTLIFNPWVSPNPDDGDDDDDDEDSSGV
ncbi:hypothetical protein GGR57DRAFT_509278 [Xylariaceae sp. FL1272]|nr:hypothetical protein GGR57DRAFT_509278 [Xylariaceae sp. FL1272]